MRVTRLRDLIARLSVIETRGPLDQVVTGLSYDSRSVQPGHAFFALPGIHVDGHDYVPQALEAGARAIFHSRDLPNYHPELSYVRVANPRTIMSPVSDEFFGSPSRELVVIGVTGTDGKSSTVSYSHQLLVALGKKAGYLSTVRFLVDEMEEKNSLRQSTPEPPDVHGLLRTMVDNGKEYAVVESTSHGLSPRNNRLGDVAYDCAVFTNVSHEHLEFHGSFEQYVDDKANLFRMISPGGTGIVNADDPSSDYFAKACHGTVLRYSLRDPAAHFFATKIRPEGTGSRFEFHAEGNSREVFIPVPMTFNVENVVAAAAAVASVTGVSVHEVIRHAEGLRSVEGRMNVVDEGQRFRVVVDYAHSPGSFRKVLPVIRKEVRGRLIILFGSAGERDTEKRPVQGALADEFGDVVIVTDEDPRGEDPVAILEDIAAGVTRKTRGKDLFLVEDRRTAIRKGIEIARSDDLLLLLGKGHESSIIYADGPRPWKDEDVVREELQNFLGR
jgi:UDP-N-acetylmuramoyl-L-alanyl-D-glutamate--2,6-diaminopimelate ligase